MEKKNKESIVKRSFLTCSDLHVREAEDGKTSRTITGYAVLFGTPSAPLWSDDEEEVREVIAPGAVTKQLLDGCDIKFTMFHDRQMILARSRNGAGTLSYEVDDKGVSFSFDAPNTVDGDKALELVRRGDISGCSFAFRTRYYDRDFVERSVEMDGNNRKSVTYSVKVITDIDDFTLAADPAYPDTSVEARELRETLAREGQEKEEEKSHMREQLAEMRRAASRKMRY